MRVLPIVAALLLAPVSLLAGSGVTNNNASCDIGVTPAATLLLPYFEVETKAAVGTGANTLFTITNTSRYPQIAHVTIWTDWAFPVLSFDLFLTGYDVQGVNLYDVIVGGKLGQTGIQGDPGTAALTNDSNPNMILDSSRLDVRRTCAALPTAIPADVATAVTSALTVGTGYTSAAGACGNTQIGSADHGTLARGYVTVDVVSYCGSKMLPIDPLGSYYAGPDSPLLFDNVLLGDYQQIGLTPEHSGISRTFDALGAPMVHIRAVPEGGLSGAAGGQPVETSLPFTFYDRYTPNGARAADRRQPLPSEFAVRFYQFGPGSFETDLKIWREGISGATLACGAVKENSAMAVNSIVRYDDYDNVYIGGVFCHYYGCWVPTFPAVSRTSTADDRFPTNTGTAVSGWIFIDLNSETTTTYEGPCRTSLSAQREGFGNCRNAPLGSGGSRTQTQAWMVASVFGAVGRNRFSYDFDASWLGNGCSPGREERTPIRPLNHPDGALVCPDGAKCGVGTKPAVVNP